MQDGPRNRLKTPSREGTRVRRHASSLYIERKKVGDVPLPSRMLRDIRGAA